MSRTADGGEGNRLLGRAQPSLDPRHEADSRWGPLQGVTVQCLRQAAAQLAVQANSRAWAYVITANRGTIRYILENRGSDRVVLYRGDTSLYNILPPVHVEFSL